MRLKGPKVKKLKYKGKKYRYVVKHQLNYKEMYPGWWDDEISDPFRKKRKKEEFIGKFPIRTELTIMPGDKTYFRADILIQSDECLGDIHRITIRWSQICRFNDKSTYFIIDEALKWGWDPHKKTGKIYFVPSVILSEMDPINVNNKIVSEVMYE